MILKFKALKGFAYAKADFSFLHVLLPRASRFGMLLPRKYLYKCRVSFRLLRVCKCTRRMLLADVFQTFQLQHLHVSKAPAAVVECTQICNIPDPSCSRRLTLKRHYSTATRTET